MYQIPPWLDVSPSDFLKATQAGAQLGHAIADSTQRAWEEQARMQMAQQEQDTKQQQLAVENAQQRLAADRLEQYRQQEAAARRQQLGIEQQGLGLRSDEISVQGRRADEQARRNMILEGIRQADETRKEEADKRKENAPSFHDGQWWVNDPEEGPVPVTQKEPDRDRQGHFYTDQKGTLWTIPPGQTNATRVNFPSPQGPSEGTGDSTIMNNALPIAAGLSKFALGTNPLLHGLAPMASMFGGSNDETPKKKLKYDEDTGKLVPAENRNPETGE